MNLIFPIFLIIVSVGIFGTFLNPTYQDVKSLLVIKNQYLAKEKNAEEIIEKRKKFAQQYRSISEDSLEKLEKMLPNHMNNIKLIVDVQRIAYDHNIRIGDISLSMIDNSSGGNQQKGKIKIVEKQGYDSVNISFSFTASYRIFKGFLEDLRRSLRLVDIASVSFSPQALPGVEGQDGELNIQDNYRFNMTLRTYWLR